MVPSKYQEAVFDTVKNLGNKSAGALAVDAVAGSGKTTTNIKSLSYLPSSMKILEVAFNKSIAEELSKRAPANATCKTLNGFGNQALTKAFGRLELDQFKTDGIGEWHFGKEWKYMAGVASRVIALLKGTAHLSPTVTDGEIVEIMDNYDLEYNGKADKLYNAIREVWATSLNTKHIIDFDDQLFLPIYLGLPFPKFDVTFGDEAQDWNKIQMMIIKQTSDRIVFFGDRRQAIYGFRGAEPRAMQNFIGELDAQELPLSICYRCAKSIVREAQKIVPHIEYSETAADGIVDYIKKDDFRKKAQTGDFVLCRTTAPLVGSCLEFLRKDIKATVRGRDIGKALITLMDKITEGYALTSTEFMNKLTPWKMAEIEKLERARRENKIQTVEDQYETFRVFVENCKTTDEIKVKINDIFQEKTSGIEHMTVHRSKGLETKRVYQIIPKRGVKANKDWQKEQEQNLAYVAITRAMEELYYVPE